MLNSSNRPNFFVVGAAKGGTTSLYQYLKSHDSVYVSPIKEPHYFCKDIRCSNFSSLHRLKNCFDITKYLNQKPLKPKHLAYLEKLEDYEQLFLDVRDETTIGEMSTGYLYSDVAAQEIFQYNPNAKIIIMLRSPVQRAFSHWIMDLRGGNGAEKSFVESVKEDYSSKHGGWGEKRLYVELGLYFEQVKRYLDVFPRNQVKVVLYCDYLDKQQSTLSELFSFLNLDFRIYSKSDKYNEASVPRFQSVPFIVNFFKRLGIHHILPQRIHVKMKSLFFTKNNLPKLSEKDFNELIEYFEGDISNLEKLLDVDLGRWKEFSKKNNSN